MYDTPPVTGGPDAEHPSDGRRSAPTGPDRLATRAARGRRRAAATGLLGGALALAAWAVPTATAAADQLPSTGATVTVHEECQVQSTGIALGSSSGELPLTVEVSPGAPAAVGAHQAFVLHPTLAFAAPWWLQSSTFLSPATIDSATLTINGTDVSPATQQATATPALPLSGGFWSGPADSFALSPVTFTAGDPGTAVLSAGGTSMNLTLYVGFGLFGTASATITCSPKPNQPALASVTVAQSSTVPVGTEGSGLLALTLGAGAAGTVAWRRRARRAARRTAG
jgi:hypothetical protein